MHILHSISLANPDNIFRCDLAIYSDEISYGTMYHNSKVVADCLISLQVHRFPVQGTV